MLAPKVIIIFAVLFACPWPPQVASQDIKVLHRHNHDRDAFLQGLAVDDDGVMYESTGLVGHSSVRKIGDIAAGTVAESFQLNSLPSTSRYFGEGIAIVGEYVYMLTWQKHTGLVFNKSALSAGPVGSWDYPGEGWGLASTIAARDGQPILFQSSGTSSGAITVWKLAEDPTKGLVSLTSFDVVDKNGAAVAKLNELEVVGTELWANKWLTQDIYRVNIADFVTGVPSRQRSSRAATTFSIAALDKEQGGITGNKCPNGIAYDEAQNRLFFSGKLWTTVYEVSFGSFGGGSAEGPGASPHSPPASPPRESASSTAGIVVAVLLGIPVVALAVILLCVCLCRRRRSRYQRDPPSVQSNEDMVQDRGDVCGSSLFAPRIEDACVEMDIVPENDQSSRAMPVHPASSFMQSISM